MEAGRTPTGVIPHQSSPSWSLLPLGFNFSFSGMSDSQGGQYIEHWRDASRTHHTPPAHQYTDLVNVAQGGQGLTYGADHTDLVIIAQGGQGLTYGADQQRESSRNPMPTQVGRTLHSPAPQDGKDSHDDQSGDGVV